jgi:hypothetical protein
MPTSATRSPRGGLEPEALFDRAWALATLSRTRAAALGSDRLDGDHGALRCDDGLLDAP